LLAAAGLMAGIMNAVAGGGSFFTFPALVFTGVPPVIANASSTVALVPAALASAWAYREDRKDLGPVGFMSMLWVSLAGGSTGAIVLLVLPEVAFDFIIPWLLLLATLAFAFGPRLMLALRPRTEMNPALFLSAQFGVAVYGGYFGGAVGLIMLSSWGLFGFSDLRMMNANKTLLGGLMNAAAVVVFLVARRVWWTQTAVMLVAAVAGGYIAARLARRMNPIIVRTIIIVISSGVTIAFFVRTYL
jgi:uncharacterized membrane protein YfcA